jgi:hypothetical protein
MDRASKGMITYSLQVLSWDYSVILVAYITYSLQVLSWDYGVILVAYISS